MDYCERDPMHEVYPAQDTSRIRTTRVKQEEETDKSNMKRV